MTMRRSSLGWGIVLLLLGGLMLADSMGLRLPGGARPLQFFWPAVLILLGGWMILGVFMRGKVETEQASVALQGAREADLRISHGAGELHITGAAGMNDLANGTFMGGLEQSSRWSGEKLEVRMSPPSHNFVFWPHMDRYDWDLRLNTDIQMTLRLQTGADKANIDLSSLRLSGLKLDSGASDTRIMLPAHGRMRADFSLGAASLVIEVPQGMAARVRVSQGVSDVKVDPARFPRMGEYYQSSDFEGAADSVEIKIDAGAASITVR
jgi:hypothetical protein